MAAISRHVIGTDNGPVALLEWVRNHQYRNYGLFDTEEQLKHAKSIAAIEDGDARKLCLVLLEMASRMQKTVNEMHREFDTLHSALTKIDENLEPKAAT